MEGQSSPPNHIGSSSLVIKTSNESAHDYTRNCDPLLDYPPEEETHAETTHVSGCRLNSDYIGGSLLREDYSLPNFLLVTLLKSNFSHSDLYHHFCVSDSST